MELLLPVLTVAFLLIGVSRQLAVRLRQPKVITEIAIGIVAGTVLLAVMPAGTGPLTEPLAVLGAFGQLGLLLFMLDTGLSAGAESEDQTTDRVRAIVIGVASFALPFAIGTATSPLLYGFAGPGAGRLEFALVLGTAFAATALPVLSRIFDDLGMSGTRFARRSVESAAVCDALTWAALAITLVGRSGEKTDYGTQVLAAAVLFLVLALFASARPVQRRLAGVLARGRAGSIEVGLCCTMLVCATLSAVAGLHGIMGAFVLGVSMRAMAGVPRFEAARRTLATVASVLMPLYFVTAGLKVELLSLADAIWLIPVLCLLFFTTKLVAGGGAALAFRDSRRDAVLTGVAMNTRGVMEIAILAIVHDAGIIGDTLFSVLIVVALIATVIPGLVLRRWPPTLGRSTTRSPAGTA